MSSETLTRPAGFAHLARAVPAWFRDAKLGVFIHWGAYSVPAWAEPIGELGTIPWETWFAHNPYAEWYANTIRIEGSPAAEHHQAVYGGAPYDDFLDAWTAQAFDPDAIMALISRAGARYVIPTTKHHDGITLWDAPGTGSRNTVARGPHRDLVGALEHAARAAGLKFGVYYSGGLDWHVTDYPPLTTHDLNRSRPIDEAYTAYANAHVRDLVARYRPDILWNDIDWPDAGKNEGPLSLATLFEEYYAAVPDGLVNDRWGATHWDYRTSEYQQNRHVESEGAWENNRGVGYSFGYNQVEDATHHLDGPGAVRHLLDVVSRGGNFLLNIGPDAAGRIPPLQRACLEGLGDWMALHAQAVHGTSPVPDEVARPGEGPWVRWTAGARSAGGSEVDGRAGDIVYAVVDAEGPVELDADPDRLRVAGAHLLDGTPVRAEAAGHLVRVQAPATAVAGPQVVAFPLT